MEEKDANEAQQPLDPKAALIINIVRVLIQAGSVIGTLYIMRKQLDRLPMWNRTEYTVGGSGKLIVNEYQGERLVKTRYATKKEVLKLSTERFRHQFEVITGETY